MMLITHFLIFSQLVKEENFGWKEEMQMAWLKYANYFIAFEEEKQVTNQVWAKIICHRIGKRSGLCLAQQRKLKFPTKREFMKIIKFAKKSVPLNSCRIRRK
jgi:hypothetical protein